MRRLALVLFGIACLGAAGEGWPQKGDTVYVPGDLEGHFLTAPAALGWGNIAVPACAPMVAYTTPKPKGVYVQDSARGATFKLCEGWTAWIVQTREACIASKPVTFQKKGGCYAPVEH